MKNTLQSYDYSRNYQEQQVQCPRYLTLIKSFTGPCKTFLP